jgi:hypothetical protein
MHLSAWSATLTRWIYRPWLLRRRIHAKISIDWRMKAAWDDVLPKESASN